MARTSDVRRPSSRATLEILGPAGATVSILAQGELCSKSQQIFEGVMPRSRRMRLRVPLSTLFVMVMVGNDSARIDFQDGECFQHLDMRMPRVPPAT